MRLLTLARDLKRKKARERRGLFVAEGVRAVEELLASPLAIHGALVTTDDRAEPRAAALYAALDARGIAVERVGEADFRSAADTDAPQGVLAIAAVPDRPLDALVLAQGRSVVLLLDGLQDPGNVGTIVRTAAAFDAAAVLAMPGTVDLWNAKVVRSAMGALFNYPALPCTWEAFDAFRLRHPLALWGADAAGRALDRRAPSAGGPVALVVGNEGAGLSAEARSRVDDLVALPIGGRVESLNAAVAAGILLYDLTR